MCRPMWPRSSENRATQSVYHSLMLPPLQIVRRSSFKRSPWKNGGGITHEAFRLPPTGGPFLLRGKPAPNEFSRPLFGFARYHTQDVVVSGGGDQGTPPG